MIETISLKGLFQSHLGKKEEALQNIKLGIRKDLTSHVCWHVFGLYYRNEKNYKETVRCYKTALKYDPGNLQILRDLGSVQIQLRDYDGFLTTKLETLELKPSLKINWISLAIAYHLVKNWDSACKVIDTFMESWNGTRDNRFADRIVDYEISELILYKLFILEEAEKWDSLLEAIEVSKNLILNKTSLLEFTAKSLAASSQKERAMETYKILLQRNPDNRKYLDAMENLLGASDEKKNLVQFYTSLMVELPQAHLSCQKRLLELLTKEDSFIELFSEYVVNFLKKGVPALFELCRPLLAEPKLAWIKKVLSDLEEVNRNTNIENFYSWILYFNCQLSLYEKDPVNALEHIEKALSIDPENVDFLMKKARCLKHLDRIETAAATMNEARLLDLSDRYINSKCAKYYLRAGDIESAQKIITLFLKVKYIY